MIHCFRLNCPRLYQIIKIPSNSISDNIKMLSLVSKPDTARYIFIDTESCMHHLS